jgi:hypothetical protein
MIPASGEIMFGARQLLARSAVADGCIVIAILICCSNVLHYFVTVAGLAAVESRRFVIE